MRWCLLALGLAACGSSSLSHTVDSDALKGMSRQGQITVYDAENEIVIALDRLDEARGRQADVESEIERVEKSLGIAEKKNQGAVAELAKSRLEYLNSTLKLTSGEIEYEEQGVLVAKATVELAKAQVIHREDLVGDEDFTLRTFEDQLNALMARREALAKSLSELRKRCREQETAWWQKRQQFVAQTGDTNSGLWID